MNTDRKIIDYRKTKQLYLQTADTRLYEHPYGPTYPKAIGKIFRWVSTELGDAADADQAFVKNVSPDIFQEKIGGAKVGQLVPITVYYQFKWRGSLFLFAKIDYSHNAKIPDIKGRDGTELVISVYLESAKRIIL